MPFTALLDDNPVIPHEVDDVDVECRECGNPMHIVSRSPAPGFRARHFSHYPSSGGGDCGGGESRLHAKLKGIALDNALEHFDEQLIADYGVEVAIGDRYADAALTFEMLQHPLGKGIAIEVQVSHDDKDVDAAERNHLEHGYSVMWIDADDDYDSATPHRVALPEPVPVWPNAVPSDWGPDDELGQWLLRRPGEADDPRRAAAEALETECPEPPLTLAGPPDLTDRIVRGAFRSTSWPALFPGSEEEAALRELDTDSDPQLITTAPFGAWLSESQSARPILRGAFEEGRYARDHGVDTPRDKLAKKIARTVRYNVTDSGTLSERALRTNASNGGLEGEGITVGINAALRRGLIGQTEDGRFYETSASED